MEALKANETEEKAITSNRIEKESFYMPNCKCPSTQHGHADGCSNPIEVGSLCKACNEETAKEFAQT
jgi:hypothetical protein